MNCIDTIQKDAVIEFVLVWTVSRSLLYVTYNELCFVYIYFINISHGDIDDV